MTEDIIELTLNSPITEEQWDVITDVDFENTDRIWFHTKHGKEVEFIKHIRGKWIPKDDRRYYCSSCNNRSPKGYRWDYCPNCGADMRGEQNG
jgi:hypothetical protein